MEVFTHERAGRARPKCVIGSKRYYSEAYSRLGAEEHRERLDDLGEEC